MENSPSGVFVLKVAAADPDVGANGQISYTLHGPDADKFHLDHRTGKMVFGVKTRMCSLSGATFEPSSAEMFYAGKSQKHSHDIHHTLSRLQLP